MTTTPFTLFTGLWQRCAGLVRIAAFLPDSLYSLILSRIDQHSENQKTLLKVATVIGRLFRAAVLWGVHNQFGDQARVRSDLDTLSPSSPTCSNVF